MAMKDKDIEKEILDLANFMWKGQIKVLVTENAIAELKELFQTANMKLARLEELIKYNENANQEHPKTSDKE